MPTYKIRYVREKLNDSPTKNVVEPIEAVKYLKSNCYNKDEMWREQVWAIFTDNRCNVLGHLLISLGGSAMSSMDRKLVIKGALDSNAFGIILSHNHPSGVPLPSRGDIDETKKLKDACNLFNLKLLDHIVLGEEKYFSFTKEETFTY